MPISKQFLIMLFSAAAGVTVWSPAAPVQADNAVPASAAPTMLSPFEATYNVRKAGITVVKGRYRLLRDGEGYVYSALAEPVGLVGVFTSAKATETSHLEWNGERLRPLDYRYELENGDDSRRIQTHYDWQAGKATIKRKGRSKTLDMPADAVNSFILNLAVMLDLAQGKQSFSYTVVGKSRLKRYEFSRAGTERVRTEAGEFDTVVLERVFFRKKEKLVTRYWCAPALQFLPVKAVLSNDNGGGFDMELIKAQGLNRN